MNLNERTKYLFADTLKTMLKTQPFHTIHIKDLCDLCGAKRQTFYYHFKDKYDLVAWIYSKDVEQSILDGGGVYCEKQLELQLQTLHEQRSFYKKVFEDKSQNALIYYIHEVNTAFTKADLKKKYQTDALSQDILFAINYNSHAWIGCIIDWLFIKQPLSASEYARMMYQNTTILYPYFTKKIIQTEKLL